MVVLQMGSHSACSSVFVKLFFKVNDFSTILTISLDS